MAAAPGHVNQTARAENDFNAGVAVVVDPRRFAVFEIKRHLAGNGEQFGRQAVRQRERLLRRDRGAGHDVGGQYAEDPITLERRQSLRGREKRKRRALAQGEEARDLVDLGAGQDNGRDRTASRCAARTQLPRGHELGAQVG